MRRERVLIVEGERMKRELLATVLEGAGFAVVQATSGEEAFARLRMERGDIDRLVTAPLAGAHVCAAILADEFRSLRRGREAVVLDRSVSPGEVAAMLQRPARAPAACAAPATPALRDAA